MDRHTPMFAKAIAVASHAHHEQRRKASGEPYIVHPIRVAYLAIDAGLSEEAVCAAVLHDVVEDTHVNLKKIHSEFGKEVAELVSRLTKWWDDDAPQHVKDEGKIDYYSFIMGNPDSVNIKLLDRIDNLRDMKRMLPNRKKWAARYLSKTLNEISPLYAASNNRAIQELYTVTLDELMQALA